MKSETGQPSGAPSPGAIDGGLEALLRKYNVSGPRYTSYPSVPFWQELGPETAAAWLAEPADPPDAPISLYFHIPFCNERCFYCGCFVVATHHKSVAEPYLKGLEQEMEMVAGHMAAARPVRQFHLGGGTPTYISPEEMERFVGAARRRFPFEPDMEMSIEVDPRTVGGDYLGVLKGLGFNRISLGVQDFDEKVMASVNRVQPFPQVAAVVEQARKLTFAGVNFDLIYGLPHQTQETFTATLEKVRALGPDRLALYNYAHLPHAHPHQRKIPGEALPDKEEKTAIFLLAREKLTAWGYQAIGMDHFALPGDDLTRAFHQGAMRRNFMGYTTQAGTDLLAFGISAISEFHQGFWQNEKNLKRYLAKLDEGELPVVRGLALDGEDRLRQAVISDLFCKGGVDFGEIGERFGVPFREHFAFALEKLAPLAEDGLVELNAGAVRITGTGQLFLRNAAMVFDAYLERPDAQPGRFSKVL